MTKIQDYAIIGNGRSGALVSLDGSIDWLCWPRFDSPSLFAALLDQDVGGYWKISPILPSHIKRNYIRETNVLETHFSTDLGSLILTDFMTAFSEEEKNRSLQPEHELIRRVECLQGEVEILIEFAPCPNYGKKKIKINDKKHLGLRLDLGKELITLRSDIQFQVKETIASAKIKLYKGQKLDFSLSYTIEGPSILCPLGDVISQKLSLTVDWWKQWSNKSTYKGPFRDQVIRSALTLKLLGYAPTGAFVAALTTSLPEKIRGDLNWDYRFCWLRDASFTVKALFGLGYQEEAEAFCSWLLHSTRLTLPKLRVLYDVYGEDIRDDTILPHFKGYKNSYPVRIGNGIRHLFELDVHGEVIAAVSQLVEQGKPLDKETQKMLRKLGKFVYQNWQKPDTGIWEKGDKLRHWTHSKLMCWVALSKLGEMYQKGTIENIPIELYQKECEKIRNAIEEKGWNKKIQSYTQIFLGEEVDASLLVMPLYEYATASSSRIQQTIECIQQRLSPSPALVFRYEKSIEEGEGAFGICSFWLIELLSQDPIHLSSAYEKFTAMLTYANDLGLFSEEIDPHTGDALGNFPQAFTHVGLINAALALAEQEKKRSL